MASLITGLGTDFTQARGRSELLPTTSPCDSSPSLQKGVQPFAIKAAKLETMTRYTKLGRKTHEEATRFEDFGASRASPAGVRKRLPPQEDARPAASDIALKQRRSEHRRDRRERERERGKTCYNCRKEGHRAERCPEVVGKTLCYRCGAEDHSLKGCRLSAKVGLPFAVCFVCKGKGHLAGECPSNAKGVYPQGGCCKICKQVDHLAKDCPIPNEVRLGTIVGERAGARGADEDDFHAVTQKPRRPAATAARPAKKVVSF